MICKVEGCGEWSGCELPSPYDVESEEDRGLAGRMHRAIML